jgi:hypothetical protein
MLLLACGDVCMAGKAKAICWVSFAMRTQRIFSHNQGSRRSQDWRPRTRREHLSARLHGTGILSAGAGFIIVAPFDAMHDNSRPQPCPRFQLRPLFRQ